MIRAVTIGDLAKFMREEIQAGEKAVKSAMTVAGQGIQRDWRAQISAAGLGARLPGTIRTRAYPKGQDSMNAATLVWTKAPKIIGAFDAGVTIRSKDRFLAIPTEAAGTQGLGRKRITPEGWEARSGMRLRFVYRRGRTALLVADGLRINSRGRAVMSRAKVRADGIQRGAVTAVIFILVSQVSIRKRLDLARDAEKWAARVPEMIVRNWKDS